MFSNKVELLDCIQGLKNIKDNTIDTIICDPPYNIGKDFGNDSDKQDMQKYFEWCKEWIFESYRVLKEGGSIFIYGFSEILAQIFVDIPFSTKKWLVWHYTNKTVPSSKDWQRSHESIIHLWKGKKIFNLDDIRESYTENFIKNAAGKVRKPTKGRYSNGDKETIYLANEMGAMPRDVIKVPALAGGSGGVERWFYCENCEKAFEPKQKKQHESHKTFTHPTQKPFELTKKLLLSSIPKNSVPKIIVPFAGSGSELVVSKILGYEFVGYDINPKYVEFANRWLEQVETKNPTY